MDRVRRVWEWIVSARTKVIGLVAITICIAAALLFVGAVLALFNIEWAADQLTGELPPDSLSDAELRSQEARSEVVEWALRVFLIAPLLVAAWLTWRRVTATENQLGVAREELMISRRSHEADRFTTAVEQLSSERLEVRLGGVFGLEALAFDAPNRFGATIQTLLNATLEPWVEADAHQTVDVNAVLATLRRGEGKVWESPAVGYLHIRGTELPGRIRVAGCGFRSLQIDCPPPAWSEFRDVRADSLIVTGERASLEGCEIEHLHAFVNELSLAGSKVGHAEIGPDPWTPANDLWLKLEGAEIALIEMSSAGGPDAVWRVRVDAQTTVLRALMRRGGGARLGELLSRDGELPPGVLPLEELRDRDTETDEGRHEG